ncbi:MAG: hypothetical protein JSS18_10080, partial [Proteobacteria bacterium]|nr:hypothetical protein [Pseudomonadota bacterium]
VTASLGAIQPGSLEVEWNTFTSIAVLGTYTWRQLAEMGIADITNTARPVIAGVDPTQYAHDDGAGKVWMNGAEIGTVNYGTGVVTWNPDVVIKIPVPEYAAREIGFTTFYRLGIKGIGYVDAPSIYPNDESGYVKLRYNSAAAPGTITETVTFAPSITLVPGVAAQAVPGSVLLQIAGGGPWGDSGTGALREFTPTGWLTRGTIDYLTGAVALTTWVAGTANSIARASCATTVGEAISSEYVFRAASAPLRPGTLSVQFARPTGGQQSVTADANGVISAAGVSGQVDYEAGIVRVRFGAMVTAAGNEAEPWYHAANVVAGQIWKPQPVAMSTVRYNATAYTYLPMDAGLLGLDPVRLPSDGRVPIFRPGGFVVIGNTQSISATVANTQVIDCARVRLSRVRVLGANGVAINTGFTMDLEAGRVTFTDVSGYAQPVTIEHRIEDMLRLSDVQIDGSLAFTRAVTHAYPVLGSYISSALVSGDLKAYTAALFGQGTWQGAWADAVSGASTTGKYNDVLAPIVVTNQGASTERWALVFTNTTAFNIVGEHVGVVGTGSINTDTAPINPATGVPYFTVKALGWGTGWAAGNALRFNTIGALAPVWVVRTIQQGPNTGTEHSFTLLSRGDVDRP